MSKTRNKTAIVIVIAVFAAILLLMTGVAGYFGYLKEYPGEYTQAINDSGAFKNDMDNRIAQTQIYKVIEQHFAPNDSGKIPKLLFVGYDGCLAKAVALTKDNEKSAIYEVAKDGGLYLGYCGGAKPGDQETSTAPGWASIFTGVWASEHGVKGNNDVLSENTRTILFNLAKDGKKTSFSFSWAPHLKTTYKKEAAAVDANNYPLKYNSGKSDAETFGHAKYGIENGEDAVFLILEATDHAGHTTVFSTKNKKYMKALQEQENMALELLEKVGERPANEDWLVIITTDHGGKDLVHGGTSLMESTTFYAINKNVESILYS